ncbi:MAG: rod-binding protein [Lachnospiraceae bacterium]|nr:rod-binding protein [Lachnospiraceae bacterium]
MDIDSSYLNSLAGSAASSAGTDKLKGRLGGIGKDSKDDQLMEACKEFEAYFVEQMFKEMQKTVPKNVLDSGSNKQLVDYFKDSLTQEYAKEAVGQQSLGLAQMLYEQMKRNYSGVSPSEVLAKDQTENADPGAGSEI